ncbi:MAG: hypothetical protein JW943_06220, partial [Deltaproteobacteria bacterium]|nr:hypothetical protein [Deltaproteobacteria bacterium]
GGEILKSLKISCRPASAGLLEMTEFDFLRNQQSSGVGKPRLSVRASKLLNSLSLRGSEERCDSLLHKSSIIL